MAVDALLSFARARKAHEHVGLYRAIHGDEGFNRWLAISLADGSCDLKPYATKAEAVRFQRREQECAYLFFTGMPTLGELRLYLDTCEQVYDAGLSLADPDTYINPEFQL
jgi:hypothetical protein